LLEPGRLRGKRIHGIRESGRLKASGAHPFQFRVGYFVGNHKGQRLAFGLIKPGGSLKVRHSAFSGLFHGDPFGQTGKVRGGRGTP
jgi:hypothetical protein